MAETLHSSFDVEIGLFDAAKVVMEYNLSPTNYRFQTNIQTDGIFATFYTYHATYQTSGHVEGNQFITQEYGYDTYTSAHRRQKQLVFDDNGLLIKRISFKDEHRREVDIAPLNPAPDAYDLQTAFAMVIKNIIQEDTCNLEQTVYNGKRVYQIIVQEEGREYLSEENLPYQGQALKCSFFLKQSEDADLDLLAGSTVNRPVYFWVLKEKQTDLPFVAKFEVESTPLGALKGYLTHVEVKE